MKTACKPKELLFFVLFLILVIYPFTEFLGKLPLRLWDESRQAANAIEMYINNDWLVTYYYDTSDTWNTKPPLLIWLQVIFMHVFGVSVTSLRLVSAVAGILTVIALFHFIKKETGNTWMAFFSGIVLTSMAGFNGYHSARTADYDALLAFFSLLTIIQFYRYVQTLHKQHILLFFLFLCLGWFTKSISCLFFLPGFFIFAILEKKVGTILTDRYFYIGLVAFLTSVSLYYLVREHVDPGYIQNVYNNEIGGRFLKVTEGHRGNVFFYLQYLSDAQIFLWFHIFLITLIFLPFLHSTLKHKKLVHYFLLLIICLLTVLTSAQTKIEWYVNPALPLIAAFSVVVLFDVLLFLGDKISIRPRRSVLISYSMVSILVLIAYINIVLTNYMPEDNEFEKHFNTLSLFFHEDKCPTNIPHLKVVTSDIDQHLYFYVKKLQLTDPDVGFTDYTRLQKGDHVIGFDEKINEFIKTNYTTHELYRQESIYIYAIK